MAVGHCTALARDLGRGECGKINQRQCAVRHRCVKNRNCYGSPCPTLTHNPAGRDTFRRADLRTNLP